MRRGASARSNPSMAVNPPRASCPSPRMTLSYIGTSYSARSRSRTPSSFSLATPFGQIPWVEIVVLGNWSRSRTSTSHPPRASPIASADPAHRAPTTIASCSSIVSDPPRSRHRAGRLALLHGKGARVAHAAPHPGLELALGSHPLGTDPKPAVHRAAAHHERLRVRLGKELVGVLGIDANEQATLAASGHRHVPADQEGKASEHRLLGQVRLVADQLADEIGEVLVVRHARMMTQPACGPPLVRLASPEPSWLFMPEETSSSDQAKEQGVHTIAIQPRRALIAAMAVLGAADIMIATAGRAAAAAAQQ